MRISDWSSDVCSSDLIFGEIGYDIAAGNTAVTPFVRLAHVDTGSDAFTETGGNAALTVGKADQKTTFLSLGARAQFNAGQPGFQPYLSAAWNQIGRAHV